VINLKKDKLVREIMLEMADKSYIRYAELGKKFYKEEYQYKKNDKYYEFHVVNEGSIDSNSPTNFLALASTLKVDFEEIDPPLELIVLSVMLVIQGYQPEVFLIDDKIAKYDLNFLLEFIQRKFPYARNYIVYKNELVKAKEGEEK